MSIRHLQLSLALISMAACRDVCATDIQEKVIPQLSAEQEAEFLANGAEAEAIVWKEHPKLFCDPNSSRFKFNNLLYRWPPGDQGQCGGCQTFAIVGAFEANFALRGYKLANASQGHTLVDASEQHLFSCATKKDGSRVGNCSKGGFIHEFLNWWMGAGVFEERKNFGAWQGTDGADKACPIVDRTPELHLRTAGPVTSKQPDVQKIKDALCKHGPLISHVRVVRADWEKYPEPNEVFDGSGQGGKEHAVLIVGWNDRLGGGAWIIRNSWGRDWGLFPTFEGETRTEPKWKGHMAIKYGASEIGTWTYWVESDSNDLPHSPKLKVLARRYQDAAP